MVNYGHGQGQARRELRSDDVKGTRSFAGLQLKNWLSESLAEASYKWQSPVQEAALPAVLTNNDVIIQSKSGTGKTLVFAVGVLEQIREDLDQIQALVLAPTREIATQAYHTIKCLGGSQVKTCLIIGGTSLVQNKRDLKRLKPAVIVGTPGRILDLYSRGDLSAKTVHMLVLDEADELLQNDTFRIQVENIRDGLTHHRLQTLCLSATYPASLKDYVLKFIRPDPLIIKSTQVQLEGIGVSLLTLKQEKTESRQREAKLNIVERLLNELDFNQAIIFAHTHAAAVKASLYLNGRGWANTLLSGRLEQHDRTQAWEQLVTKATSVLIATDVGARGLDSAHADLIINIELTSNAETLTHRIGRCGRFGNRGEAVFIVGNGDEVGEFEKMAKVMKLKVNRFDQFDHLTRHCKGGLSQTAQIREREMVNDDRVVEEIVNEQPKAVTLEAAEQAPIRHYPKPVIPPLWDVLNLPGPMHYCTTTADTTATIDAKPKSSAQIDSQRDIDSLSDEAFQQWRQANPRATESMMAERYASDNPLANHFINSFLDSSSESTEELTSSDDEEDEEIEAGGGGEFAHEFDRLYRSWRVYHSKNAIL